MEVTFINPGVDYMIQRIMAFQTEDESAFWSKPLYHFYPQLDKAYATSLSFSEKKAYIERTMRTVLDTLDAMYKSQSIEDFMQNSYAYCREHEAEIRAQSSR